MAIDYEHQIELLKDILQNQISEHDGSHEEFHQLQSLVQSLVQNRETPAALKDTLLAIEQYAYQHDKEGQHAHIYTGEVAQWIQQVDESARLR